MIIKRPLGRMLLVAGLLSGLAILIGVPGADANERPQPPIWQSVTDSERGYIDLSWRVWQGTEGVNVYRDSSYITTVKGDFRYRDHDGQPDSSYALIAFRNDEYSSWSSSKSPERIRPEAPSIKQVGDVDGRYTSVVWYRPPGIDGVNVYRNNQYIGTVRSGTVYNDYHGRLGDEYYLISFRDDLYSSRSLSVVATAGSDEISAAVELQPDSAAVVIRWKPAPGVCFTACQNSAHIRSVMVYRKDNGGQPSSVPDVDQRIGKIRNGYIVDPNPVRGASYGVFQVLNSGATLPVVTVRPEYTKPLIRIQARCSMLSEHCFRPFGPAGPGTPFDDIEVIPVDPSLPDFDSNLMADPTVGVLTESIESGENDGVTRPSDKPQAVVPLNSLTDPDNDGLSVLSDDDNDNDGVPTGEDRDDTNPNIGRPSSPGGGDGDDDDDDERPWDDLEPGDCSSHGSCA